MFGSTVGRAQARPGACRQGETTTGVSAEGSVRPASSTNRLEYRVQRRGKSAILPLVDICVGRISTLKALQPCCPCATWMGLELQFPSRPGVRAQVPCVATSEAIQRDCLTLSGNLSAADQGSPKPCLSAHTTFP